MPGELTEKVYQYREKYPVTAGNWYQIPGKEQPCSNCQADIANAIFLQSTQNGKYVNYCETCAIKPDLGLVKITKPTVCTCDFNSIIMIFGCQCGGS